jgi:hypothetical protein
MEGIMDARTASISQVLIAMRKLGVDQIIEFSVKVGLPNVLLGHTAIAAGLMGQDKWILSLPVVIAKEGTPPILDEMTVIRQTEREPIVVPEGQDEHISESLPEICDQEELEPEIDLCLAEQVVRQTYAEDRENGGLEDLPFGWPV